MTTKGQNVVPKELRNRLKSKPGTTLDWIRQLGRVPAAPRDMRKVAQQ